MTQQVTDVRTLEGLLDRPINLGMLTKVNGNRPKIFVPIKLQDKESTLYFVYNRFSPKASDIEQYGVIAIAYDEYYTGIPVSKFKPRCRKQIMNQIFQSPSFKKLNEKYAIKRAYNNVQQAI